MTATKTLTVIQTEPIDLYTDGRRTELTPGYSSQEFAALLAAQPDRFRVRARVDCAPAVDYRDEMAGWKQVGVVCGAKSTNAAGPCRVRAIRAAEELGLRCDE